MAFLMGNRLRDMIRSIRACKTAAEERTVVAKECAALRDLLKEPIQYHRHRNIAKLMFIHMLGYPTHFGQMECIKVIAESDYPEKRIGYLGLMVLLDERQEVLMLVTNSIKNDLHHSNQHVIGLALCALGNICTAEMARDLTSEVERLLNDNNAYIRKKAALCAVRIIRKAPDLIDSYKGPASNLLLDKHHGVLVSGVKLCIELCRASDTALEHFRKQVATIVRLLKNLVLGGYVPEYDVSGISDPLLQIKLLKLLRLVGKGDSDSSDIMSDVLAQVATNTDGTKNAGKAILYECVLTIMAIEDIGGLRVLAINILGRFLASMDNNVRYVALNTLAKVVAVDNQAVQRHRTIIVNCVKDSDVSIRARALELVVSLVNEKNVKALTTELLEYLKVSDPEFKVDLAAKIAALVYKYAPTKLWYIDQLILIMMEAGKYVKEDVVWSLVAAVSNATDLQGYAVRALHRAFRDWSGQESLAQVTVWCIGEYGDMLVNNSKELEGEDPQTITESDAVDVVESVLHDLRVSPTTIAFSLTALLKLTSRFPQCSERIKALLEGYSRSTILELQQRSIEFGSIISRHSNLRGPLLERMPVLDLASYYTKHAGKYECRSISPVDRKPATDPAPSELTTNNLIDMLTFPPEDHCSAPSVSAGDALLNILGVPSPTPTTVSSIPVRYSVGGASTLLDILSVGEGTNPQNSTASRRPSTLEALLSSPKPDHRLSILELDAQPLHATPVEADIPLRTNPAPLVEAPHQISSLPFVEIPLTDSRSSVVGMTSQQPTLAEQKRISMNDARQQESLTQLRRKSLFDEVLKNSEVRVTETWPTTAQQRKLKEESESRLSRLSFLNEPHLSPKKFSAESSGVSRNSGVPADDTWPSNSQQQKLKEDSAVRTSRMSFPSPAAQQSSEASDDTWPSPAQQQKLKEDSGVRISRLSFHTPAPGDEAWPSPSQQQKLKEDSAVRISRLSYHNASPPPQEPLGESLVPAIPLNEPKGRELPPVCDVLPSPTQQQKLKEDSGVRISRMSFHSVETPVAFQPCEDYPPIVALQTQGLRVDFEFTKNPELPQSAVIKASFTNMSSTPYTDFVFQAAVPKYMTLKLNPASGSSLPQNSVGAITQILMVTNSMHGQKPLIMRLRISYKIDGKSVLEQGQVNHFPPHL